MSNKFKFCPKCGKAIIDDDLFCRYCGASLRNEEIIKNNEAKTDEIKNDETESFFTMLNENNPSQKQVEIKNNDIQPKQQSNMLSGENLKENNSGEGKNSTVPPEVANHFNWGSFIWSWIWCFGNKKYLFGTILLVFYIILSLDKVLPKTMDMLLLIISLVFLCLSVYLGVNANKWAWQTKEYKSVKEFHSIQKKWIWVPILIGLPIAIAIALATELPELQDKTNAVELKVNAKKSMAVIEQASQLGQASEQKLNDFSSEGLASYYKVFINGKMSGADTIRYENKKYNLISEYTFVGDGNCKNDKCYIKVDTNGSSENPNKEWTEVDKPSDIFIIPIKNENGYPVVTIPIILKDANSTASSKTYPQKSGTTSNSTQKRQTSTGSNGIFDNYMDDVKNKINAKWTPPKVEKSENATVLFKVAKDGKVVSANIEKSSGNSTFNEVAINTIKNIKFKALPKDYEGENVDIRFTFDYNYFK